MDASSNKNLLFLLAIAPMGMGGCISVSDPFDEVGNDEVGDGDGDPTTTGDGDGDPTTTGDGDGDPTTTGDGDGDPTTTGDGDGDPTTGDGDGDGDGDPTTGDGDGDPGNVCTSYAELNGTCYGPRYVQEYYEACVMALSYYEMAYGPDCVAAYEAYLACLSELTCEEFMNPDACPDEQAALATACGG